MTDFAASPTDILARLEQLRAADAPTHGGHVLSYVYDSGLAEIDELAASAIRLVQPVNGLDPTTFSSVAVMEREVIAFARELLGGSAIARGGDAGDGKNLAGADDEIVGSVTTGGTESCLLAVKTARDNWRAAGGVGRPRLLAPVTVHAAFQKATHYFDLELDLVPVDPTTGTLTPEALIERMAPDVALVVVSAPSYPFAALDPVVPIAAAARDRGIDCHVDACIGGWVLPFWKDVAPWDFRVPGVTSISADLHKFGYAPKGASVLLHRGRDRQRTQYFATTNWPGYPVVNSTMLGSKSVGALAASWAIIQALGMPGFARLADSCAASTRALLDVIAGIDGLRVVGDPVGPLLAVAADESVDPDHRVDPHHWADEVRALGWLLQLQPGLTQPDRTVLPATTHLTITPVTERVLPELSSALASAADRVRGVPPVSAATMLEGFPALAGPVDSATAVAVLGALGLGAGDALPDRMAPLLAAMEALPAELVERLLTELLARLVEPGAAGGRV